MVIVTREPCYNENIGQGKSLPKRGKRFADCAPELVPRDVELNTAKVTDMKTLLASHYGDKWIEGKCCQFFKKLFNHIEDSLQREAWDGEESVYCEHADVSQVQDFTSKVFVFQNSLHFPFFHYL
ncbi:hypothetical protein PR048_005092 [Dryococelus australis]|uniref:Uncharacterized protein n=1 Tax=Dryococelus australis TaxID=614101 RepID=A0ABQ9I798_9NEOP|nr:hypothetical protein PR048_005092 [Dryococelus australis]